jgi:murein DD-endopeptidase MepM/ murein hydrolase activator NlpD
VNLEEVAEFNELAVSATLSVGDEIIVPDAELAAPVAPKRVASNIEKNPTAKLHDAGGPSYPGYYIRPIKTGTRTQGLHGYNAVDLAAAIGTSIYASAKGVVIVSSSNGSWNHGYGNYAVIAHPNGTQTLYAHMSQNLVSVGEQVSQGDIIGKIGLTGKTTGPHIHFEIRGAKNPF